MNAITLMSTVIPVCELYYSLPIYYTHILSSLEFVQVQFEKDLYTVKEGEDFTVRIIAIDNTVSQNFEVIVQPINGTAEGIEVI